MLWVDKHRPKRLDKLVHHNKRHGDQLKKLVAQGDCPHLLFYGPPGSGKKTLCLGTLRELFGPGVEKIKSEVKLWQIQLPSRKVEVELATLRSNYHLELNPAEAGRKDVHVVQEVIKEMAKTKSSQTMFLTQQQQQQQLQQEEGEEGEGRKKCAYKVLLINDVDRLTRHAQHALRRTMEKYSKQCRLVMTCTNLSKVIDPVQSRCICVRVKAPGEEETLKVVQQVAQKEHLTLPETFAGKIAKGSSGSLRKALLTLETCRVNGYPFKEEETLPSPEWELFVKDVAAMMLREQTPKQLFLVRGKLYELLINCLPPSLILSQLVQELMLKLDDTLKVQTISAAAMYEHRLQLGSKPIFHLEAFVAKFMALYKAFLSQF
mmetsp:Transcript_15566/g.39581  ORF Transcript_15566/g.39581 Transcript_15566/m.39581 type:complete len:376 (+) Transcript_15566:104-1231(+)